MKPLHKENNIIKRDNKQQNHRLYEKTNLVQKLPVKVCALRNVFKDRCRNRWNVLVFLHIFVDIVVDVKDYHFIHFAANQVINKVTYCWNNHNNKVYCKFVCRAVKVVDRECCYNLCGDYGCYYWEACGEQQRQKLKNKQGGFNLCKRVIFF